MLLQLAGEKEISTDTSKLNDSIEESHQQLTDQTKQIVKKEKRDIVSQVSAQRLWCLNSLL